jgi:hypothetical protein
LPREEAALTGGGITKIRLFTSAAWQVVALLTRTKPPPTQRGK